MSLAQPLLKSDRVFGLQNVYDIFHYVKNQFVLPGLRRNVLMKVCIHTFYIHSFSTYRIRVISVQSHYQ